MRDIPSAHACSGNHLNKFCQLRLWNWGHIVMKLEYAFSGSHPLLDHQLKIIGQMVFWNLSMIHPNGLPSLALPSCVVCTESPQRLYQERSRGLFSNWCSWVFVGALVAGVYDIVPLYAKHIEARSYIMLTSLSCMIETGICWVRFYVCKELLCMNNRTNRCRVARRGECSSAVELWVPTRPSPCALID